MQESQNALDFEQLDAIQLQSVSESIATLLPQCLNEGPTYTCTYFFCGSNVPPPLNSEGTMQYRALPPPSRYVRSARQDSLPPRGPIVAASKEIALGPIG